MKIVPRLFRSKLFIGLLIAMLFGVKLAYDGISYVYVGFRHASTIFSPADVYLGKAYGVVNSIFSTRQKGLSLVKMYLSEKSQRQLTQDPPKSLKKWKQGRIAFEDGKLRKVKIRHRGENIRNYAHLKKSWRIKLKRKKIYNRERVFNYVVPRGEILRDLIPYWVAEASGLVSPGAKLVELFMNGRSHGVMLQVEQPDENFLRNSGLMPVNLYKGEPGGADFFVGPFREDQFNSVHTWSKQAVSNFSPEASKGDLEQFLRLVSHAAVDSRDFEELKRVARYEEWIRFSVFQELVQSWHNARLANLRLVFDNWKGIVFPFPWDTTYAYRGGRPVLDRGSHELLSLYLRRSDFVFEKFKELYRTLNEVRPLDRVADRLTALEPKLRASLDRDAYYKAWSARQFGVLQRAGKAQEERAVTIASLRELQKRLLDRLNAQPDVIWSMEDNGFSIALDGELPFGGLEVKLDMGQLGLGEEIKPIKLWLDTNLNGVVDAGEPELRVRVENDRLNLDAVFIANRSRQNTKQFSVFTPEKLVLQKTHFRFISNLRFEIAAVKGYNSLTQVSFAPKKADIAGYPPNKWNRPVSPAVALPEQIWSGTIAIDKTRIVRQPTRILAGAKINMSPGASLVFTKKLTVEGTADSPVQVVPSEERPWGTFALLGKKTANSKLMHLHLNNGSGDQINSVSYTGMLSIHDTRNITITGLVMDKNHIYDDMVHIIYGRNIMMQDIDIANAAADAIDIDISTVALSDIRISGSGNDAIDFMDSKAIVQRALISNAGDKGLSVGEGSTVFLFNSVVKNSKIGLESKDGSTANIAYSDFVGNDVQLNAYRKNWRYGTGGTIQIERSVMKGKKNIIRSKKKSRILVSDSAIWPTPEFTKRVEIGTQVQFREARAVASRGGYKRFSVSGLPAPDNPATPKLRGASIQ